MVEQLDAQQVAGLGHAAGEGEILGERVPYFKDREMARRVAVGSKNRVASHR